MRTIDYLQELIKEVKLLRLSTVRVSLDIPPLWVRKATLSFDGFKTWPEAYKILCDYYGIPYVNAVVDAKRVPQSALACFYSLPKPAIVSRTKEMSPGTGIHEFFHYLAFCTNKSYDKGPSEAMTRAYTTAFLEGTQ